MGKGRGGTGRGGAGAGAEGTRLSPQPLGGPHRELSTPSSYLPPRARVLAGVIFPARSLRSPMDQEGFKNFGGLRAPHTGHSCGRSPLPPRLSRGPHAHATPGVAGFGSCSSEGLMLKLKLQSLATSCEELTHWKRP